MAINVRYGPEGALLSAAVQTGQAVNRDRRFAQEQQLVDSVRQYQMDQDRMRLDAYKLQLAGDLQRRMTGSPIPSDARRAGPLAQSISQRTPFGLSPAQITNLDAAKQFGGTETSRDLLQTYVPGIGGQQQTPGTTAKRAFLQSMFNAGAFQEADLAPLLALADSADTDLADVRQAVSSVQSESRSNQQAQQFQTTLQKQDLDNRARSIRERIEQQTRELTKAGFDPVTTSVASLQPEVRQPGGFIGESFRGLADTFLLGQPYTSITPQGPEAEARAAALAKRQELARLQAELSQIEQQRSTLTTPRTQQPQTTTAGKTLTQDLARQFLQQAGGDKNKARELARQQGYSF